MVAKIYSEHQYLTTGMPASLGGDSGGPVWTVRDDGHTQIIGLWLGDRTTPSWSRAAATDGLHVTAHRPLPAAAVTRTS
jgi:hypothetical protein